MLFNAAFILLVFVFIIWRLGEKKELFSKLSRGERIYTILIYTISMIFLFFGGAKLKNWISTFEIHVFMKTLLFYILFAMVVWSIVSILVKILPKKVMEYISNE
jgi:magnesium-transporting ATPase (P-type)